MRIDSTEQMIAGYMSTFNEMIAIIEKKSNDYGVRCWQELGAKGLFADINRKYWRLRNIIWDGNEPMVSDENIRDTVLDLANHCIQLAIMLKENEP